MTYNPIPEIKIFVKTTIASSRLGLKALFTPVERWGVKDPKKSPRSSIYNIILLTLYIVLFPLLQVKHALSVFYDSFKKETLARFPKGRLEPAFQNRLLFIFLSLILLTIMSQPASDAKTWRYFTVSVVFIICYYAIMSIALNLQTGATGIVNFGVIFFVGIGMAVTGILSTRYSMPPLIAMVFAMLISAFVSYLLAFLSLRLRTDYFAIVTIALGEFLRALMKAEPTFQTKRPDGTYSIGISNVPAPFKEYFVDDFYAVVLTILAIILLAVVYLVSELLLKSPYGRVLRAIREDEGVVEAYGYDVFFYKASVLAIGGAIFSIAGSLWVWSRGSVFPSTINVAVTFFIWAAFIIGGKGNNKGMILGAAIIATLQTLVTKLSGISGREKTIIGLFDSVFRFLIVDVGGGLFGEGVWKNIYNSPEEVIIDLNFAQIFLVGIAIFVFLRYMPKGILPEEPFTPRHESRGLFEDPDLIITRIKGGHEE